MATIYDVSGFDILPRSSSSVAIRTTLEECVTGRDLVFVAVPTPHHPDYDGSRPSSHLPGKDFDYEQVSAVLEELNGLLREPQLVVLVSTVLPGTIRRLLQPHVRSYRFVYNPYFIAMGSVEWDMVHPEMVLIGTEDGATSLDAAMLISFYRPLMKNDPRYVVCTWDEAEAIKVFYNTFISAKISLVNMIQDVAEKNGNINTDVVTDALAKSTLRITGPKYLHAGMGDAGPCHPRDNIALSFLSERLDLGYDLFRAIMRSREIQARNLARLLVQHAIRTGLPIFIHGKSYKPDLPLVEGSYSVLVGHYCAELGSPPTYVDPLAADCIGDRPRQVLKGVFLLAHNPRVTFDYLGETRERPLYCEIEPGSVVIDPWREFSPSPGIEIFHFGDSRKRAPSPR
jgi:UDPglucose 6-dehydrogenase